MRAIQPNAKQPGRADPIGYIHSIETGGTVDGPGIRYVAFLQGCPLRCLYCHNPDSWKMKAGRACKASELVADILRYRVFIRQGGVTLSGGEPLAQAAFVAAVFALLRQSGLHTAIDTSGVIPLAHCEEALMVSDLVILDIKALDAALCKTLTGSEGHNALAMLQWCENMQKPVWIRHVVVPGYTDRLVDLARLAAYLAPFSCIKKVELLPFHQMAQHKWEHLEITYQLADVRPPDPAWMHEAYAMMRKHGLPVRALEA